MTPAASSYPDISTFKTNPATTFVLDATGLGQIGGAKPFMGSASACPNGAVNVWYPPQTNSYLTDIYSPVAGVVSKADSCVTNSYDRYGFNITFASYNGSTVDLAMTLEPFSNIDSQAKFACSGGVAGQDNGFYKQYLFISAGQTVTKGQRVAQLYHPPLSVFPADIVNNPDAIKATTDITLSRNNGGSSACPNIFSADVESQFVSHFMTGTKYNGLQTGCAGGPYPQVLCSQLNATENLTGR
jgi:hypothetical protein